VRRIELHGEREVTASGSVSARVRRLADEAHVVVIEVGPGGVVARHPAVGTQLEAEVIPVEEPGHGLVSFMWILARKS
jgi:hypothetical protein